MKPYAMSWNITNKCNLNCIHCNLRFNNEKVKELSFEECKKIIDNLYDEKVFLISFSGGEPLVRDDFIDIIKYCHTKNITSILATNGTLLTEDLVRELKENGTTAIALSLDSTIEEKNDFIRGKGTYNQILKNMEIIKKNKMNLILSITVDENSVSNLKEALEFAKENGCNRVKVQVVLREENEKYKLALSPDKLKYVAKICAEFSKKINDTEFISFNCYSSYLRKYFENGLTSKSCNAGEKRGVIMPNGDLYLCELLPDTKRGNLITNTLDELWDGKLLTDGLLIEGKCKLCQYSNTCRGGCPIFALNKGELNDVNCRGM